MRPRLGRRELVVVAATGTAILAAAVSFGPLVKAGVVREAARRRLDVTVGGVRPGWFAIRLIDVEARPHGLTSMRGHADEIRAGVGVLFRLTRVDVRGAVLTLTGSTESLREDWRSWRGEEREPAAASGRVLPVEVAGAELRWIGPDSTGADLRGISLSHDDRGTRISVTDGHVRLGRAALDLGEAAAEVDARRSLVRAHAGSVAIGWTGSLHALQPAQNALPDPATAAAPTPMIAARGAHDRHPRPVVPSTGAAVGEPLLALPNLHGVRAATAALATLLAEHVQPGADVGVESLTWKVVQDPERVALTFGPGPLSFTRTASQLELRYSTNPQGTGTPLGLRALLPTDGGDVVVTVDGGPVSLALLGVQEGAAGLVDVDRASVGGRARVALAGDGSALTFDVEAGARGLSLDNSKLALEVVHGLDLSFGARGAVASEGDVRLDDFAAALGALRITGSGTLEQRADHVAGSARFEIPVAACQSLLDSIPAGLLPALEDTRIAGTFGARGRFAFDTRSLDDLHLDYDVQDRCRLAEVPPPLDRERFTHDFLHRIYLPDGSTTEETTGPGTPDWTPLDQISPYMQTAVLTTEDGAFPKHHGYNHAAIRASIIANLKARRFVRGASTITMQLAKNLFLSRDKTLSRKVEEVVLTDYLEQTFSKDELMELYLNVIEFGPAVYGITQAAEYYFGRTPAELDLAECLFLSSLLPAPIRYSTMREGDQPPDGWMRMIHSLMEVERKRGLITDAELSEAQDEEVRFWHGGPRPAPRAAVRGHGPLAGSDSDIPDPFETVPDAP